MRSPLRLNSGCFEAERPGDSAAPNLAAEAARAFGFAGEEIRLAPAHAGVREGQKIGASPAPASKPARRRPSRTRSANARPSS
jgi:hypothetical protein